MSFSFHVPTNLVFGQGAIQKLHKQRLPGKHALIVISSGKSTRANRLPGHCAGPADPGGVTYTVFDKILANPVLDNVMDGAACAGPTAVTLSWAWAAAAASTRPRPLP